MNVLILGVGDAQVDAIRHCKSRGFQVHGLSYRPEGRGLALVDSFAVIDITDKQAVGDYADREKIDIVYSVGSDVAMPTIGYVSQALGLPFFVDERTATLLQNKASMKALLSECGIGVIPYQTGQTAEAFAAWSLFPAVMKPVDSQGQRGVFEIRSQEELRRLFPRSQSFSRSRMVIVEKYIGGPEVSCNAFVHDGIPEFCFLSDRAVITEFPGGIVRGHRLPSRLDEEQAESVMRLAKKAIGALPIRGGPVYFQFKYDLASKEPFIIEVTPRLDGCHLWRLVKLKYGVDLLQLSFNALIEGKRHRAPTPLEVRAHPLFIEFFYQKPGTPFVEPNPRPSGLYEEFYYKPGEMVRPINTWFDKVGYQIRGDFLNGDHHASDHQPSS